MRVLFLPELRRRQEEIRGYHLLFAFLANKTFTNH